MKSLKDMMIFLMVLFFAVIALLALMLVHTDYWLYILIPAGTFVAYAIKNNEMPLMKNDRDRT